MKHGNLNAELTYMREGLEACRLQIEKVRKEAEAMSQIPGETSQPTPDGTRRPVASRSDNG